MVTDELRPGYAKRLFGCCVAVFAGALLAAECAAACACRSCRSLKLLTSATV